MQCPDIHNNKNTKVVLELGLKAHRTWYRYPGHPCEGPVRPVLMAAAVLVAVLAPAVGIATAPVTRVRGTPSIIETFVEAFHSTMSCGCYA